jgi:DNA-binding Xre family transcriptional regulator
MARLRIRLRECLELHAKRTGRRLTYPELARKAGLSEETIQSIATRSGYNATLLTVERLCTALRVSPAELLVWK